MTSAGGKRLIRGGAVTSSEDLSSAAGGLRGLRRRGVGSVVHRLDLGTQETGVRETITTTSLTPTSGPAGGAAAHLRLPDKDAVVLLAGEVALALHRAVVLALGLVQDHAHPLPGGEKRVSDVGHRAALSLPDHLHQGAHLHRSAAAAATVGAHPAAAAAGRLRETDRQADRQVQCRVSLFPTIFGLQWSKRRSINW